VGLVFDDHGALSDHEELLSDFALCQEFLALVELLGVHEMQRELSRLGVAAQSRSNDLGLKAFEAPCVVGLGFSGGLIHQRGSPPCE
jgi:hypothetical protein